MRIKGFMLIFQVRMEERQCEKGSCKTEAFGMKMLAYVPVRDGAVGLQQPSTLRRTGMFARKVWKG